MIPNHPLATNNLARIRAHLATVGSERLPTTISVVGQWTVVQAFFIRAGPDAVRILILLATVALARRPTRRLRRRFCAALRATARSECQVDRRDERNEEHH